MNEEHRDATRDEVRCPECGARNTAGAQWCTQCYTPLAVATPAPPPPPPPPRPPPPPPPASPPTSGPGEAAAGDQDGMLPLPPGAEEAPVRPAGEPRLLRSGQGQFRETDEGLEWVCAVCQEWNSIDRLTCSVCATPFGRTLGADAAPERPDVPAAVLTVASLVLPGAGHWLLRMRGAAVLRAILGVVWGLGGLTLFLRARESGQSFLPAIPLLLGWAVVAAGSANDAVVEAGGSGTRVLAGRFLLWLTLGVVGGTFAAVLVGVLSAVGQ